MALTMFGVTYNDVHHPRAPVPGTELIVMRDLAAIVADTPYEAVEPTDEWVTRVSSVVGSYHGRGTVLPAPVGVVFRSREAVERWLELHYVALSDALSFVDDRVVGRVHVSRPAANDDRDAGTDLSSVAAESLRVLRRSAVATVPLRVEQVNGVLMSAAFLVEQERWREFASTVQEQGQRASSLRFELTGPWPPYDFVQMQFGG